MHLSTARCGAGVELDHFIISATPYETLRQRPGWVDWDKERYRSIGSTDEVDFHTTRNCRATAKSHVSHVVLDTETWEASAAFYLEAADSVESYVRNDHLDLVIPYEFLGQPQVYIPDFLVRLRNGVNLLLEVKGYETEEDREKHTAAHRWVAAVNNWGELGCWAFAVCRDPASVPQLLAERGPAKQDV